MRLMHEASVCGNTAYIVTGMYIMYTRYMHTFDKSCVRANAGSI